MNLKNLVNIILQWISINTDYDISKFNTPINIIEPEKIQHMVCGGKCPVVAFFSEQDGIFLSFENFNDICNQSILLHEMIHSFQVNLKMENAFKEKEAYDLQNKFLEDLSLKNDMINLLNVKLCRSKQFKNDFSGVKK